MAWSEADVIVKIHGVGDARIRRSTFMGPRVDRIGRLQHLVQERAQIKAMSPALKASQALRLRKMGEEGRRLMRLARKGA